MDCGCQHCLSTSDCCTLSAQKNGQAIKNDLSIQFPKKPSIKCLLNYWLLGQLHHLAGRNLYFFVATFRFSKNATRTCPLHLSEFIVSENKVVQIVLVTLSAHHSFTLVSRNSSLYTILGLSTCHCLLL